MYILAVRTSGPRITHTVRIVDSFSSGPSLVRGGELGMERWRMMGRDEGLRGRLEVVIGEMGRYM